ncbi:hypothetical protein LB456_09065 [Psychroflexus sp. CAK57W]|uniref:hypothetical protein n=1 Tax=Psychroflexus curvus TaxID=2873595 RepID=UPI001CCC3788|nr:hypothetical protein [Psychroflexus curvus]MBZ9787604.1 hypothetical protein [Psychroflexus curvus]
MKYYKVFNIVIIICFFSLSCKTDRKYADDELIGDVTDSLKVDVHENANQNDKIAKAVFFIENSASMFGYVNGFTEYVDVISDLSEKQRFALENTDREFFFVNGGKEIQINNIGNDPILLKDQLNPKGFDIGDVSKSNLNSMLQLAMGKAKKDTISILISDGLYDIGKTEAPLNALSTKGKETRSRFIERLSEGDLQTIILKMNSRFKGNYYPVTGGIKQLSQNRPYYIWIFGRTKLLNEYFPNTYNKSLSGFQDSARFLKIEELEVPYEISTHEKRGAFKTDIKNKNILTDIEKDRNTNDFQFSIAVDFSDIPFSESYLTSTQNYSTSNSNYEIAKVSKVNNLKLYGLKIEPTHLVFLKSDKNPFGALKVSLQNNIPNWIEETAIDNEDNIKGDTKHTFGFKFLTDGIFEAYEYINNEESVVSFNVQLNK